MLLDGGCDRGHTGPFGCDGLEHRWRPAPLHPDLEGADELLDGLLTAGSICLVDDEDVADLDETGLCRLDGVSPAGRHDDNDRIGRGGNLDLGLADTDGLDDDLIEADPVEQDDDPGRGLRDPAEMSPV